MSNSRFMAALEQHLYLTQSDIEANRRGIISEAQIARIRGQLRSAWIILGCLASVFFLPILLLSMVGGWQVFLGVLIIGGIISMISGWRGTQQIRAQQAVIQAELLKGEVAQVQGYLEKKEASGRLGQLVGIGGEFFSVPKALYPAIPEGDAAIIYYLPSSKHLLSLELIDEKLLPMVDEYSTL
jgi:hypothetical protein